MREEWFTASDGLKLFVRLYPARQEKSLVFHVHGLNEHSGRFIDHWNWMAAQGFTMVSFDLRNHGKSEGKHGAFPPWERMCRDVAEVVKNYAAGRDQYHMFIHSMGAVVGGTCLVRGDVRPRAVVASSPAMGVGEAVPKWARGASHVLAKLPGMTLKPVYSEAELTNQVEEQRKFREDPLNIHRSSPRSYLELLKASQELSHQLARWTLPTLVTYGGKDRLTSVEAMKDFYERLPASDKALYVEPEARHELLFDRFRMSTLERYAAWFDQHL
jgi:alpha-beta hydrolase superfamily lysophospholipase